MIIEQVSTAPRTPWSLTGPAVKAGGAVVIAAATANYLTSPWDASSPGWGLDTSQGILGMLLILGMTALGVGVIFGAVAHRALGNQPHGTARTALVVAIVGALLTPFAFWSGIPIVLGLAAVLLGRDADWRLGHTPFTATIAIVLGTLTALVTAFFCLVG